MIQTKWWQGAGSLVRELGTATRLVVQASPGWSAMSALCVVLLSVLPLASLYLTKLLFDAVVTSLASHTVRITPALWRLVVASAAVLWLQMAVRALANLVSELQGEVVSQRVQEMIAEKSLQVDLSYYESPEYFSTLHQAQREAPFRPARIVAALAQAAQSGLSLLCVGGLVLVSLHWSVVLLVAGTALPGLYFRMRNSRRLAAQQKALAPLERRVDYYSWLGSVAAAAKEVRVYRLGGIFVERVREARRMLLQRKVTFQRQRLTSEMMTQGLVSVALVAAFSQLIRNALRGVLSVGDLVMSFQAFQRAMSALQELIAALSQLYEHGLFMGRLTEFLGLQEKIVDPTEPMPFPSRIEQGIRFENVAFQYPSSASPVIESLNLTIGAGKMVALVGENGAGKSTLIKLLCRLYEPTAGRITIDNIDLKSFRREDLWAGMSILFQDFGQYQATVNDNIWFGEGSRPPVAGELEDAAVRAGADEFVRRLPRAYEQMLGSLFEGGQELSGGQWQKLALSRAMLRGAPIIVLDEPTSALDVKAEHDLFLRFKQLTTGQTSLVISHRMSTVRMADRIYYFENGRITEAGSHDELVDAGGSYAQLFETQASNYR